MSMASMEASSRRWLRPYTPKGLWVFRGPQTHLKAGDFLGVGDNYGYAKLQLRASPGGRGVFLYIENMVVKEECRGQGHGRALYQKIEELARRIGVEWLALDAEEGVEGFWRKMGFKPFGQPRYKGKRPMSKRV